MSTISKIQTDSNWGTEANKINQNFTNLNTDIVKLQNTAGIKIPLFSSVSAATASITSPYEGQLILVGSTLPAPVYRWNGSSWANTGVTGGSSSIALTDYYTKSEVNTLQNEKLSVSSLASGRGESTTTAMTQAAVTQELAAQESKLTELSSYSDLLGKYVNGCNIIQISFERGYIDLSGNFISESSGSYFSSNFIKVEKGRKYYIAASGSTSTYAIAAYDTENEGSFNEELSTKGSNSYIEKTIEPESTYYIRVTANIGYNPLSSHGVIEINGTGEISKLYKYIDDDKKSTFINLFKNNSECDLLPTENGKFISYTDGTKGDGTTYNITEFQVKSGDKIKVKVGASTAVSVIAAYKDGIYVKDSSIKGTGSEQQIDYYIENDVTKIIVTNNTAYCANPKITYTVKRLEDAFNSIGDLENLNIYKGSDFFNNPGFIKNGTGNIEEGGYSHTDFFRVEVGSLIIASVRASSASDAIALYDNDNTYIDSVRGIDTDGLDEYRYIVNNPVITKARVCTNNTFVAESTVKRLNQLPNTLIANNCNQNESIPTVYVTKNICKDYTLKKRKAVFSFIFDDGVENDELIKDIFDEYGLKCGFAIYSANDRYKSYYKEEYEILAHAASPVSDPNEEKIKDMLQAAYNKIISMGIECKGWVTPSSALDSQYQSLVYDLYEYGFTIYKGATTEGVGIPNTQKTYQLWRSSLENLTTEQCKTIIDEAVTNSQLIVFYAHAANLDTGTNNLTTTHVKEVIEYCKDNGYGVLPPYDAIRCFFSKRHNE